MVIFLKKNLTTIVLYLGLLFGLGLLLYPNVSDWWNSFHQSRAIISYVEEVEDMSGEDMEMLLDEARAYNRWVAAKDIGFHLTEEEKAEYESLLNISGTGIMGYVQIPNINVSLPVYHGTDEAVLQIAVGHIAGSSLPVGGESTHSVLSGHRGLPSAKLLTDLDQIREGDIFTVTVLNEAVTYQVDQIRIVLPAEVSDLKIVPGEDYCTLVTCTPYGINTHRMLVRGRRIENIEEAIIVNAEAIRIKSYLVIPAVGLPIVFILLATLLIYYHFKRPERTEEALFEELKKIENKE